MLKSWAVPKGPSPDPTEKRLAVHVEDHPVDYADFEGVIPAGEYGAGPVIVWDRGRWIPREDPVEGLEKGKLLFELRGHKLRGVWTLVRIKRGEEGNEWLLIRERTGLPADEPEANGPDYPETSILSGLTVEELAAVHTGELDPSEPVVRALEELEEDTRKLPRRRVRPADVGLMLARRRERPFSDPEWLFEVKLDGFRMLAGGGAAGATLLTRNGKDATAAFPEVARALEALPYEHVVLDGELVVHDEAGLPSFQLLQGRARLRNRLDIRRAAVQTPATYYAFELLGFADRDVRETPLAERKRILRLLLPPVGPLRYSEHFPGAGEELYEHAVAMGLEGIVAKRADSPYRAGRSDLWRKVRAERTGEFAIVGYTAPGGTRTGFGALHVAGRGEEGALVYAGKVGTGFSEELLRDLHARLQATRRPTPACEGPVPRGRGNRWVEPDLVCEVRFKEWTRDGLLRAPAFLRLREDRRADDAIEPAGTRAIRDGSAAREEAEESLPEPSELRAGPAVEELPLSNLDKVFWPEEGITKGDLIDYYRAIAPWLLPYLRDRPLVLTRYPDGIEGKSFFQKDAPDFVPDWIRTLPVRSEGEEREISYFVVEDETALVYLVNLGTIPIHMWASRAGSLDRPDWCVLDLDPKTAPFEHVVTIARALRELCEDIGLPTYVKTSGATGLHILIPLAARFGYDESRSLGELLARLVAAELPEIATTIRAPARRGGRVYVDFLQNRRGQTIVAPYAVRPLPGATASAPLRWREVGPRLAPGRFHLRNMPRRARALKEDPLRPVLDEEADLLGALGRLRERLAD